MTAYSVYIPSSPEQNRSLSDAPRFVVDGFSWPAFFLGPLWCVFRRTWLALSIWISAAGAVAAAAFWSHISETGLILIAGLLLLVFAEEANLILRRSLERRGMRLVDHVIAPNIEAAELRFFERWARREAAEKSSIATPTMRTASATNYGIGLFPEAGG